MQQAAVNLPSKLKFESGAEQSESNRDLAMALLVSSRDKVKDEASSTVYAFEDVLCLNVFVSLGNAVREATTLYKISHPMEADQFRDSKGFHMLLLTALFDRVVKK